MKYKEGKKCRKLKEFIQEENQNGTAS